MRKNLPVTNKEYVISDDMLIVSKTDPKGKITFVNDTFVKVSGFDRAELIGAPHNIVRHPDMPAEAFADVWQTLQAGEPWTGAVKNRCKNGDFYWVLATATPLEENGKIVGYMSVRRALPKAIREAVTAGYKLFVDGQADGLTIRKGSIVKTSLWARYKGASASIRSRTMKLLGVLSLLFVALGYLGFRAGDTVADASLALAMLGPVIAAFWLRRLRSSVVQDSDNLKTHILEITNGDYTGEIDVSREDEFARARRCLKALQIKRAYDIEETRILTEAKEKRQKAVESYIQKFETSVSGILEMVSSASTELESTAHSMSSTAEEAQRQSTAVAAASEQASTNVQTVASAAEELSSSISEISRQVAESTRITSQAVTETEHTNAQIQGLAEAAQRIGDVVKLINDIAGQTNLLALNATIEAARAGEAGKGFAVVASEVKSLASQTAKATEEISAKIAEMQSATSQSVQAVQGIGRTIARINEIATTIASAVEEQGAATQEIARNVQQASAGTAEVSSNIVVVTKAANDTGTASTQVLGAAGELSKQSETLRNQVDGFLSQIRAA